MSKLSPLSPALSASLPWTQHAMIIHEQDSERLLNSGKLGPTVSKPEQAGISCSCLDQFAVQGCIGVEQSMARVYVQT